MSIRRVQLDLGRGVVTAWAHAVVTARSPPTEAPTVAGIDDCLPSPTIAVVGSNISFIGSLDPGLPFQSFDILRLMPLAPSAAVQLAVTCDEPILHKVIEIDEKLPLSWFTTNPGWWTGDINALHVQYEKKLRDAGLTNARQHADDLARKRIQEVARSRPCMSVHMAIALRALRLSANEASTQKLKDAYAVIGIGPAIAGSLLNRLRDSASSVRTRNDVRRWPTAFDFRSRIAALPTARFEAPEWAYSVLDAPCAAAAIALGEAGWTLDIERAMRILPRL